MVGWRAPRFASCASSAFSWPACSCPRPPRRASLPSRRSTARRRTSSTSAASAMAPDGTGGIVYRKRVDGRTHIFAAQFDGSGWRTPQRVDAGQRFDSSWPAIGAGNGGRLVVAWVQEFGPSSDRMYSAGLDPGARRFQAPVPVDLNVGESTGTSPSVAMNAGGSAYITYLVMQAPSAQRRRRATRRGELRAARYDGSYWSGFGLPLNRNAQAPLRLPAAGRDAAGDDRQHRQRDPRLAGARRRVRSTASGRGACSAPTPGSPPQVSPDVGGPAAARGRRPVLARLRGLRAGRDRLPPAARRRRPFGGHADHARHDPRDRPRRTRPRSARRGSSTARERRRRPSLLAPRRSRSIASATPRSPSGSPSAACWSPPTTAPCARPSASTTGARASRARRTSTSPPRARPSPPGRSGAARPAGSASPSGAPTACPVSQALAAPAGGVVSGFALAGTGLGDGIVGWSQGGQIAAVVVDAPPDPFAAQTPSGYVRTPPLVRWDMPPHAIGGVTFAVTIDDDTRRRGPEGHEARAAPPRRRRRRARPAGRRDRRRRTGDDEPPGRPEGRPDAARACGSSASATGSCR